jgi:hypothetical protein
MDFQVQGYQALVTPRIRTVSRGTQDIPLWRELEAR